jgi:hypothetical protein
VGSLCAGAAGALEVSVGRRFLKRRTGPPSVSRSCRGRVFYLFAAAVAASPLPFTVVRMAALSRRPRPIAYGACVAAGRLPRYALTVLAWDRLGFSGGAMGVVVAGGLIVVLARTLTRASFLSRARARTRSRLPQLVSLHQQRVRPLARS